MTRFIHVCVIALSFLTVVNAQKLSKMPPNVVLIGIGEKNQTFNENLYPNLKIYYTPDLKPVNSASETGSAVNSLVDVAKFTYEGTPDFIKTLWNEKEIDKAFMMFDKNGLCVSQGYNILKQNDIGSRFCTDKKPLSEHVKNTVKKDKTGKAAKKEMKLKKSDFMIGFSFPDFELTDAAGKTAKIADILGGKATLVVFFNIPSNIDTQVAKESGKGKSGKAFLKGMVSGAAGAGLSSVFIELESQIFEYDAREK